MELCCLTISKNTPLNLFFSTTRTSLITFFSSSIISSISATVSSLDSFIIFFSTIYIILFAAKIKTSTERLHSKTIMTTSIGLRILFLYLLTPFPIFAHAKTTTHPARNHNTPPQLLCLDSGFCVPKIISTPSLDLESRIRLHIHNEASLTPQFGGRMLDANVVFAVKIAEQMVGEGCSGEDNLEPPC
jgi:hypothetical protein